MIPLEISKADTDANHFHLSLFKVAPTGINFIAQLHRASLKQNNFR